MFGLCWQTPLAIVWIVGIVLAISRWHRHPRVSAAVLMGIACMLSAMIGMQLAISFLNPALRRSIAEPYLYLRIGPAIATLIRVAGIAAMLVAIFGWREAAPGDRGKNALQFSIRGLLVTTLVVAVLCGLLRGLVAVLGESANYLWAFVGEIPVVICWVIAVCLAWTRWKRHPEVSQCVLWAIGFQVGGLVLNKALGMWIVARGGPNELWPLVILSWLLASTVSGILLLRAAFGWRTTQHDQPNALSVETEA